MIKKQNKNLLCKIQSRFVSPPISRVLRHAGGHVGPILLPRTHRGIYRVEEHVHYVVYQQNRMCPSILGHIYSCKL